ncbi:hypothetical protein C8J57DRAFT_1089242, partial [Mycena rebaudengoi]
GGDSPTFAVALSTGETVAIMNSSGGNGRIVPTSTSPARFSRNAPIITFPPLAGGLSHPHIALQYGMRVFVPDLMSFILGGDKIWWLPPNCAPGVWKIQGWRPRHIAIGNAFSLFCIILLIC